MADGHFWNDNPELREEAERQQEAYRKAQTNGYANADGFYPEPPDPADCSAAAWLLREIPDPDFLLGPFSTTSRGLISADTGLGKTNLCMALAHAMAEGTDFLHWSSRRKARVLYIEGEMSKRLVKARIADAVRRLGPTPDSLYILSADDHPVPPLNSEAGQKYVDRFIEKAGGMDFVLFDNVQALLLGNMSEEEPWKQTLPWIGALTRRSIGQLWIHHTGHDKTRGYGTKTREWQMDMVMVGEAVERAETDIALSLRFSKAREKEPRNREDFATVTVTLQNDKWNIEEGAPRKSKPLPPLAQKFLAALHDAVAAPGATIHRIMGRNAVTVEAWKRECRRLGLLDNEKPASERALFSENRRALIAANAITINGELVWSL